MEDTTLWKDLIVCDGVTEPCTYKHLVELIGVAIHDLTIIATLLATVGFMYAGFLLLTSEGSVSKKEEAKRVLANVLKGFIAILAAWIVVYTITSWFLKDGYSILGN